MGHPRADLAGESYRFWTVYSYVICYRSDRSPLQIITVIHGARRIEAFLAERIAEAGED